MFGMHWLLIALFIPLDVKQSSQSYVKSSHQLERKRGPQSNGTSSDSHDSSPGWGLEEFKEVKSVKVRWPLPCFLNWESLGHLLGEAFKEKISPTV